MAQKDAEANLGSALTLPQAFGTAVRELRLKQGLSQEAAALHANIDRAYFGRLERAGKVPTLTTVWKIAAALGTTPSELLARTEHLLEG
ncbi:MAG TPA: helix-turn-helix transcriptional regulator [Solirubrobacterales bacterium]|nr:helix-turn-helix transcriptional regulator [Solirubrobacterales bacterium]